MEITGITSQDLFARFTPGRGSNVCFGDSGGPALYTLPNGDIGIVGVTSFATDSGCVSDAFAAFANVQSISISEFIIDTVPGIGII